MVEAMAQTPMGQAVFERLGIQMTSTTAAPPSAPAEEI
jgi:hypothetical protein